MVKSKMSAMQKKIISILILSSLLLPFQNCTNGGFSTLDTQKETALGSNNDEEPIIQVSAPTDLRSTSVTANQIQLSWIDESDNEQGFSIEVSYNNGVSFSQFTEVVTNTSSYIISGLTAETDYRFRIRSFSGVTFSDYSNVLAVSTLETPPNPVTLPTTPRSLTGTVTSATQINLSWSDTSSDEDGFYLERRVGAGQFMQIAQVAANVQTYSVTNLTAATSYSFRIRAYNSAGASNYSSVFTVSTPTLPPTAPGSLAGTVISQTQINLTWLDNSSNETGFYLEQRVGSGQFLQVAQIAANAQAYSVTNLTAATSYSFRIRAYNTAGTSSYSSIYTATTPSISVPPDPPSMPTAPGSLAATVISTTQINLTWADNSSNETGFYLEQRVGSGQFTQIAQLAANLQVYSVTNLTAATGYSFRIRAYNSAGASSYSSVISATTQPPANPNPGGNLVPVILATGHNQSSMYTCDGIRWRGYRAGNTSSDCHNGIDCDHSIYSALGGLAGSTKGGFIGSFGWGAQSRVFKTIDGQNWTMISSVSNVDKTYTGIAYGNGRYILHDTSTPVSDDEGATWTVLNNNNPVNNNIRRLYFADVQGGGAYIGLGDGGLKVSQNNGASFIVPPTRPSSCTNGSIVSSSSTIMLVGDAICRSRDRGTTWEVLTNTGVTSRYNLQATFDGTEFRIYDLGANRVLRSSNDGTSWTSSAVTASNEAQFEIYDMAITYNTGIRKFIAIKNGRDTKFYSSDDGITWQRTSSAAGLVPASVQPVVNLRNGFLPSSSCQ